MRFVEPDYKLSISLDKSIPQIKADQVWDEFNLTGLGVIVAFMDSGIDADHPDFKPKQRPAGCPEEIQRADRTGTCTRVVAFCNAIAHPCPTDPEEDIAFDDNTFGHGTHVAGISAGNGSASNGTYRGVAPNASIVMVRAFNSAGFGSSEAILRGYDYVVDYNLAAGNSTNISIFSHSWGCWLGCNDHGQDTLTQELIKTRAKAGVFPVVAAGNSGITGCPLACAAELFAVGAVNDTDDVPDWSGQGPGAGGIIKPDVVAPGVDIIAPRNNPTSDYYRELSGTSMATPHVSGVAALLKEWNTTLTYLDYYDILRDHADKIGGDPNFQTGYGRVDAHATIAGTEPTVGSRCSNHTNPVLRGRITNFTGTEGLQDVKVELRCQRGAQLLNSTFTNETGHFEFQAGEGNYTLSIVPPETSFFPDASTGRIRLFNDTNTTWHNVSLHEGGRLTIKVVNQTATNISNIIVQVANQANPQARHVAITNTVGDTLFRLPVGDYLIQVEGRNNSVEAVELVPFFGNVTVGLREHPAVQAVLEAPEILQARAGPDRAVNNTTRVIFDGLDSQSYPDDILSYRWDFGDGSATTIKPVAAHEYPRLGTHIASLTIINGTGSQHTDQATVWVAEPGNWNTRTVVQDPPQDEALLGILPTFLTQGKYPWLDITRLVLGQNATHVFMYVELADITNQTTGDGEYIVQFKVGQLAYRACASVNFATNLVTDCVGSATDAESIDREADLVKMSVPRNQIDAVANEVRLYELKARTIDMDLLSPTFAQELDSTVGLLVTSSLSWTTKTSNTRPSASFLHAPSEPFPNELVRFTDTSADYDGSPARWQWRFGNGFETSRQHPVHVFTSPGCYRVTMQVWDPEGNTRTASTDLRVKYPNGTLPSLEACQITGTLTGYVLDATNLSRPVAGVDVALIEQDATQVSYRGTSLGDGSYTIRARPGTYRLWASPDRHEPYLERTIENISILDGRTTVQDVTLEAGGFITSLVIQNQTGVPVEARLLAHDESDPTFLPLVRFATSTGEVRVRAAPGAYNVTIEPNPQLLLRTRSHANVAVVAFQNTTVNGTLDVEDLLLPRPYPRQSVEEGAVLGLSANRSIAQPAAITNWTWDLGEGTKRYGEEVNHSFPQWGEYHVTLNVTDADGGTASEIVPVYVNEAGYWNTRRIRNDTTGAIPAHQDLSDVLAFANESSVVFHLQLVDLAAPVGTTEYGVNFTYVKSGIVQNYTVCAQVDAGYAVFVPFRCVNSAAGVAVDVVGDFVRLGMKRTDIGLANRTTLAELQAYTAEVVTVPGPTRLFIDVAPDATPLPSYFLANATEVPEASFVPSKLAVSTLEFLEFFDTSWDEDGDIETWAWDFGDGNGSAAKGPAYRYVRACTNGPPPLIASCSPSLAVRDNENLASERRSQDLSISEEEESP